MATSVSKPEPMNATTSHSKVRTSLKFVDPLFVAGGAVSGKMEMECKTDKGLGIGIIMVELFAIEGTSDILAEIRMHSTVYLQSSRPEIILLRKHFCIVDVYSKGRVSPRRTLCTLSPCQMSQPCQSTIMLLAEAPRPSSSAFRCQRHHRPRSISVRV